MTNAGQGYIFVAKIANEQGGVCQAKSLITQRIYRILAGGAQRWVERAD